ncbi:MAG: phasin family protein [Proteobacteria bacterium]|nr:phasin family protein [Pseudomonadota bacterium]MDA1022692.1 phasin family protein [Pseudomonadota bacterium]
MTATKKNTSQKTAQETVKTVEAAMAAGQETIENVVKAGTEAFKGYEDVVSYGKDNVDALMKSNAIFVQGFQDINSMIFGLAQASLENSVTATKTMLGCKTPKDLIDAQAELARTSYASALEDSRKISDLTAKVAEAVSLPISKQVNKTVEKFSNPIAA